MGTVNRFSPLFVAGLSALLLGGCAGLAPKFYDASDAQMNDPALGLTRGDYRQLPVVTPEKGVSENGYGGFKTTVVGAKEPPIPDLAPILAAPPIPKIARTKLVSIAVTDDVPLKDVLLELSRLADVDIEVDANISGGIAFRANQRPFNEVIERIADFAGLRYSMKNGVLRVERDLPYVELYNLDFLNFDRNSTSSVNISTSVLSGGGGDSSGDSGSSGSGEDSGGGSGAGGLTTGSQSSIMTETKSDFWAQFEAGIGRILSYKPQQRVSAYKAPPSQVTPGPGEDLAAAFSVAPVPIQPMAESTASSSDKEDDVAEQYTFNRQAGTLTVIATQRQHDLIKRFIEKLDYNSSAQVLIEAKIVEVTLNENYQSGIDWTQFAVGSSLAGGATFGGVTDPVNAASLTYTKNGLTGLDIDLNLAVALTQTFGTTRTLSSPRLHAINNQQAVLTFAKNEVYFTVELTRDDETNASSTQTSYTVTSTINTVPIGIIMSILPSINRESGEITLNVRPTLSRVVDRVVDPSLTLALALNADLNDVNLQNEIPVVEVRELDSILKVKSGQVMVIGGLMEDRGVQSEGGIPGMSELPVVGNLFKGIDRNRGTSELVIFIRATLVDSAGYHQEADKVLINKFTQDPRPLNF